jgi:hypothetical protein
VPQHRDVALGHTSSVGSSAQQGHHHIHLTRQIRIKVLNPWSNTPAMR